VSLQRRKKKEKKIPQPEGKTELVQESKHQGKTPALDSLSGQQAKTNENLVQGSLDFRRPRIKNNEYFSDQNCIYYVNIHKSLGVQSLVGKYLNIGTLNTK
jgi:hypothetical protein